MALVITNGQLLDPAAGERPPRTSVRMEGDRIVEVAEDGGPLSAPDGVPVIDAGGRTLMPGLIDAHVHPAITTMDLAAMARRSPTRVGIETKLVLERMLRRGFTTVRGAGGLDVGIQEALRTGLVTGPRVFRSGRVLSQTGGHGDIAPASNDPHIGACTISSSSYAHVADGSTPSAAPHARSSRAAPTRSRSWPAACGHARRPHRHGPVHRGGDPRRSHGSSCPPDLRLHTRGDRSGRRRRGAVDRARQPSRRDRGPVHGRARLLPRSDPRDLRAGRPARRALNFPAESLAKLDAVLGAGRAAISVAVSAGVDVGFGTDLLGETHDAQSRELVLRAQVQSAADVIRSATMVNAALLGRSGQLGVVAAGAHADLLLVDGDPLADIGVLGGQGDHLDLIVRAGEIVKNVLA